MKFLAFGVGFGMALGAWLGRNEAGGSDAIVFYVAAVGMLAAYLGGRLVQKRFEPINVSAVASAEATATAAAQGNSVTLNVYTPTATDKALGYGAPASVQMVHELTDNEILELAPDRDYQEVLGDYYSGKLLQEDGEAP